MKKSSLAYKIVSLNGTQHDIPTNLCPFVRSLVFHSVILLTLCGVAAFGLYTMLIPILVLFHLASVDQTFYVGLFLWGIVFGVGVFLWNENRKSKLQFGPEEEKIPPGMWESYFRAAHDKVCPEIEFED